ncbi:MAG: hypothetical protein HC929_14595 [Leptolyngbyaceae cyanobacterium SM2_5_2]|nr:hypothetical protein [Leptolyngbyaceae cyanobacterium SM2_5_2]
MSLYPQGAPQFYLAGLGNGRLQGWDCARLSEGSGLEQGGTIFDALQAKSPVGQQGLPLNSAGPPCSTC